MKRKRKPSNQELKILAFLLENQHREYYGLEIGEETGTAAGVLYPILKRLELKGWIKGSWENIDESKKGRRRRKYYALTSIGVSSARNAIQEHVNPLLKALGGLQT